MALSKIIILLAVIIFLFALVDYMGLLNILVPAQLADTKMGYGMLFIIGLITSVHCIAMCGGINLSQCLPKKEQERRKGSTFLPSLLYNLGRVTSYTTIGFILGLIGWTVGGGTGISTTTQGILKLIAGLVMIIMGINMLGVFPKLHRLRIGRPEVIAEKIRKKEGESKSPLFVGMLNGLMPCGPLQSMQIVALATGNPFEGALSMFLFSVGTVPLMLGLGAVASSLGKRFHSIMTAGAILVVVLGLAMLSQGMSLSSLVSPTLLLPAIIGLFLIIIVSKIKYKKPWIKNLMTGGVTILSITCLILFSLYGAGKEEISGKIVDGKQVVETTLKSNTYDSITVEEGRPVRWNIYAPENSINGCNNRILIDEYGIEYTFKNGDNTIEFTPNQTGKIQYSCWMGMIRGTITVVERGK